MLLTILYVVKESDQLNNEQRTWCCQVCWNLGVIHARAEDFNNAQFCFKWCHDFTNNTDEFYFKSAFYYLTTKICCADVEISEDDFNILEKLEHEKSFDSRSMEIEVVCLKIEMVLKTEKWTILENILTKSFTMISYETIAEIVLRTASDIPLRIYHLILSTLTERQFDVTTKKLDLIKFSKLFRGMITCSLLQYPSDLSHFQTALKIIKSSFGSYPGDETTWLCGTSLEMGRQAVEVMGDWNKGAEWTEMAMNLVYLIPETDDTEKFIKKSLKEAVKMANILVF